MKYSNIFDTSTDYMQKYNSIWETHDSEIPDISQGEFYDGNFPLLSYIEDTDKVIYNSKYITVVLNDNLWTGTDGESQYRIYGSSLQTGFNQVYNRIGPAPTPYVVTVTQNGVDVTDKYYILERNVQHGPTGEVSKRMHMHTVRIPRITGDIVITTDHDNNGGGGLFPQESPSGNGANPIIP